MTRFAKFATMAVCMWLAAGLSAQETAPRRHLLAGSWTLIRAEIIQPDGTRVTDPAYGPDARGMLMIDGDGRYSLQIFRPDRPKFAAGEKTRGTASEYQAAVLGMSAHAGRILVDSTSHQLVFRIELSAYPNWEGAEQKRDFELAGDELTYTVPATASGRRAVSVWRRVHTAS